MIKHKKQRAFLLIVMVLSLSACSSKIIYNNLDWLTYWYIDDYVALTDEQETLFDPVLTQFLDWHRQSELQSYITQIKRIQTDINNGVKRSDIEGYIKAFTDSWQTILVRLEPGIVKVAYTLKEKQVEAFLSTNEQRNLDQIEEHQSESKQQRLDNRLDKIENRIESYTGKLTRAQKQLLKNSNDKLMPTFDEWIAFRRAWLNSISAAFDLKSDKSEFEKALSSAILQSENLRSATFKQKIEHNQRLWVVTLEQLINSLDEKQRKKLNGKLEDTIEDIEALL
ncbi:hypothetical protein GCM10007916_22580 [Psychromonas marina]|uniref:Lipoprotein n=1 Tax=Psychromonas marina TaxID=88364 RepID=A0ABQ6E189_9GAMM|nr:DUF6279 family lipoprotein [Psychromonas marina]GLS91189.1 hypothetical protein GCM10007916_22580 [Psychromonas marina]